MAPEKVSGKNRKSRRDEHEVAHSTQAPPLGRPLPRSGGSESGVGGPGRASHGDEPKAEPDAPTPREDRAG